MSSRVRGRLARNGSKAPDWRSGRDARASMLRHSRARGDPSLPSQGVRIRKPSFPRTRGSLGVRTAAGRTRYVVYPPKRGSITLSPRASMSVPRRSVSCQMPPIRIGPALRWFGSESKIAPAAPFRSGARHASIGPHYVERLRTPCPPHPLRGDSQHPRRGRRGDVGLPATHRVRHHDATVCLDYSAFVDADGRMVAQAFRQLVRLITTGRLAPRADAEHGAENLSPGDMPTISSKGTAPAVRGTMIHVETCGGGGCGPAWERAPELVPRDVLEGEGQRSQAEAEGDRHAVGAGEQDSQERSAGPFRLGRRIRRDTGPRPRSPRRRTPVERFGHRRGDRLHRPRAAGLHGRKRPLRQPPRLPGALSRRSPMREQTQEPGWASEPMVFIHGP